MKPWILAATAALVLVITASVLFAHKPAPAPELSFSTLQGQQFRTADLRGQVVLVNFWATSCGVCIAEMPALKATHEKFQARGFRTLAVSMDYDPPARVGAFFGLNPLPFTFVLDRDGRIARGFGDVRLTPTSFVLNRRGEIVHKILGQPDFDALHRLIDTLLAEPS